MLVINVLNCLEALTLLHQRHMNQQDWEESKQTKEAHHFFYARESILSYLISQNALTIGYTEAPAELEPNLNFLQNIYFNNFNPEPDKEIYFVQNDKTYA